MKTNSPSDLTTLVVIRFSALGDIALTVPVLLALSESYPGIRIVFCTRQRFAALFDSIPNVEVLSADLEGDHKGILGLNRLYKRIRTLHPTAILDLHNVLRTRVLRLCNLGKSIPFVVLDKGRDEKRRLTRSANKEWLQLPHTTSRYAEVLSAAGFPVSLSDHHRLASREIRDKSLKSSIQGKTVIGIAPFAAHEAKMYDRKQLEKVVAWLETIPDCKVLIFGGGIKEKNEVQTWEDQYSNCINLIGKFDFQEELNVISQLDLMLSMDSGNGHLSALFGVPTLTLWGVTHPYLGFAPYGQPESNSLLADRSRFPAIPTSVYGNRCPKGYEKAINTISVTQIQDRMKAILGWD